MERGRKYEGVGKKRLKYIIGVGKVSTIGREDEIYDWGGKKG